MGIFISGGVTILGFFLIVFIYLLTIIRPNVFNSDNNIKPGSRFYVSHKAASFIYPFAFVSFMICAYPLSILAIILIFDGFTVTSMFIIIISAFCYILFIKGFQKITSPIVPFWKLHKQSTHKIFVYYIINSLNIFMALISIAFILPVYKIVSKIGITSSSYYITILMIALFSLWGFIYFVIQNASFVYVLGTEYILYEKKIIELKKCINRIKKIDLLLYENMNIRWKNLLPDKEIGSNLNIEEIKSDIKYLKSVIKNKTC